MRRTDCGNDLSGFAGNRSWIDRPVVYHSTVWSNDFELVCSGVVWGTEFPDAKCGRWNRAVSA